MSLQKLGNKELITNVKLCTACIFTVNCSPPAAQRTQVKWLTPVKTRKHTCSACALFQCSLIRSDAADAAAAGHKATQRRCRPPDRRRTALYLRSHWEARSLLCRFPCQLAMGNIYNWHTAYWRLRQMANVNSGIFGLFSPVLQTIYDNSPKNRHQKGQKITARP